ncbi:beta-soluble NSF attachment protein-like isoform X2 [Convolutriloba macropyga]|uniref:beta-soluble NSF attachment protein-like isoform X2 n=1 Tax=Convolutriloba macropyga TaxID=536237 RepID=UPI003F5225DE
MVRMVNWEQDGDKKVAEAEKLMKKVAKSNKKKNLEKKESACKLFASAGHDFSRAEQKTKAVDAFVKAAVNYRELTTELALINSASKAAKLVEKRDGGKAAEYYESAAKLYIEVGQHARAAKQLEKAAALYELKLGKKLKAMKCYEKGLKHFLTVGKSASSHRLLRFGAKEYFMKAVLSALAIDDIRAKNVLNDIIAESEDNFEHSREFVFCSKVVRLVEKRNLKQFKARVKDFVEFSAVDKYTSLLFRAIEKHFAAGQEFDDVGDLTPGGSGSEDESRHDIKEPVTRQNMQSSPDQAQPVNRTRLMSFDEDDLA